MMSLLPTMEVDLAKPWSEKVWVFDAGEGIMFSYQPADVVRQVGGYNERWRFKHSDPPARALAHNQIVDTLL